MSSLKKFAAATPRPLPVIVLADVSGSMNEEGKIEALNMAIKEMVSTFSKESRLRAEIQVGLITFYYIFSFELKNLFLFSFSRKALILCQAAFQLTRPFGMSCYQIGIPVQSLSLRRRQLTS